MQEAAVPAVRAHDHADAELPPHLRLDLLREEPQLRVLAVGHEADHLGGRLGEDAVLLLPDHPADRLVHPVDDPLALGAVAVVPQVFDLRHEHPAGQRDVDAQPRAPLG